MSYLVTWLHGYMVTWLAARNGMLLQLMQLM